jgi:hypothetical protein
VNSSIGTEEFESVDSLIYWVFSVGEVSVFEELVELTVFELSVVFVDNSCNFLYVNWAIFLRV